MNFSMNPQPIIDGVETILNASATLNGAGYLGSTGRIFGTKAPNKQTCPFTVVTLDMLSPDEMSIYVGELRVFLYFSLLANGQIDPNQSRCLSLCESLLNNAVPVVSGVTLQPLFSLGIIPAVFDSQDMTKSRGVLRFRVEAGISG